MEASEQAKKLIINTRPLYMEKVKLWNGDDYLGYCHRVSVSDKLRKIDKLSKKESISLLEKDIKKISSQLNKHLVTNVTQNQFDALVSLVYDIGIKALITDELFILLNKNKLTEVASQFRKFNKYMKKPIYQLIKNRKEEIKLFNKANLDE
jgi:lysozyme